MSGIGTLILVAAVMCTVLGLVSLLAHIYNLNNIKNKTVGDGQHGTARWARKQEILKTYKHIPFTPELWREGMNLPTAQGIIVGCHSPAVSLFSKKNAAVPTTALIDDSDVHALMIGAAGVGKTAYWLYPNLEYACASGMSFVTSDTKGDLYRNYGNIAKDYYGYNIAVIDLRNPTRSDGNNLLHLVNKYQDLYKADPDNLAYKAKAEKYAKIISKTIILSGMDAASFGQNAYFYDAAEGLLTATILLVAELCEPKQRHIVSVFKVIQELLAPSKIKGKNQFQLLIDKLPSEHKAKWFAGAALNTAEQSMNSVMSTALSRLNAFLDSELEQILCFDTAIDAERFCNTKSAIFIVMPEEDSSKYFMVSLIIQQLYREILAVADETGGKLKNRVMMYLDEFGTLPKIESAEMMFSASRSRRVSICAIIQSFAQLDKNYGKKVLKLLPTTRSSLFSVALHRTANRHRYCQKQWAAVPSKAVLSAEERMIRHNRFR
jgi:type IV secretion system protein VirD4